MKFTSRKEAGQYKYGAGAGNPNGRPYDPARCAELVSPPGRAGIFLRAQCSRKPGYGPEGIFCKLHDPENEQAKRDAANKRYDDKVRAERPRWRAGEMLKLLRESQTSIGGDWRQRRDDLIKEIDKP